MTTATDAPSENWLALPAATLIDVLAAWREKAAGEVAGQALDCGHFLPEERPQETLEALGRFFEG